MQKSQIVPQNSNLENPSSISRKTTIDLLVWDEYQDTAEHMKTVDVSHWNAVQVQRFWDFVHAN